MLDLTLGRSLRLAAERDPGAVALRFEGATLTHGELNSWGNRLARALLETGLRKGDRLGVLMPNSPLYVAIAYGAAKAGIALVLLNYRFTGAEIAYHLGDAGAAAIAFDPLFQSAVDAMHAELPALQLLPTSRVEDLVAMQSSEEPDCDVRENDILVLQYTSGTTGHPKGAIITHRNRSLAFLHWPIIYGYSAEDRCLHTGPFHHSAPFGLALSQLCLGGSVVIMPTFKADEALRLIEQESVTWCFMVPYMYNAVYSLLRDKAACFHASNLRVLLSGASPLPTVVKERVLEAFPNAGLFEFYGATEAGTITVLRPEDQRRKIRCVGKPALGAEVKIVDSQRRLLPNGEIGEIFLKTPSIFDGYFHAPEKTAAALHDGWCTLGDLGRLDDEGYLYIVDRLKDVIKSGGVNIYPSEIEEVVLAHPDVLEAAVIGVPDARWGEAARALIVPQPGRRLEPAQVIAYCRGRLADYKIPKSAEIRAELPHSPAGKILKRALREEAWSSSTVKV